MDHDAAKELVGTCSIRRSLVVMYDIDTVRLMQLALRDAPNPLDASGNANNVIDINPNTSTWQQVTSTALNNQDKS